MLGRMQFFHDKECEHVEIHVELLFYCNFHEIRDELLPFCISEVATRVAGGCDLSMMHILKE